MNPAGDRVVLAPTDMSESSGRAVAHAAELARCLGKRLVLLHVLPQHVVDQRLDAGEFVDVQVSTARVVLQEWYTRALPRPAREQVTAELEVCIGDPAAEILATAEERHADMIVMATHGRTGLPRALFGSVAEAVLRRTTCPVLTLRASREPVRA